MRTAPPQLELYSSCVTFTILGRDENLERGAVVASSFAISGCSELLARRATRASKRSLAVGNAKVVAANTALRTKCERSIVLGNLKL